METTSETNSHSIILSFLAMLIGPTIICNCDCNGTQRLNSPSERSVTLFLILLFLPLQRLQF